MTPTPRSTIFARPLRHSRIWKEPHVAFSAARTRSQKRLGLPCEKREQRSAPALLCPRSNMAS